MSLIKRGPFKVPKLTEEHPLYGRLLAREAEKLVSLPDFSKDKGLFILSDFGGEHKGADFTTYSFLICSADKRIAFEEKAKELRVKHGLNDPWKEFGFKDLNYGPISRSLEEFLSFNCQLDRPSRSAITGVKANWTNNTTGEEHSVLVGTAPYKKLRQSYDNLTTAQQACQDDLTRHQRYTRRSYWQVWAT